jgi:hypothetical protein
VLKLSASAALSRAETLANPRAALLCYRVYLRTNPPNLAFYRDLLLACADPSIPVSLFDRAALYDASPDVAYELYRDGVLACPAPTDATGAAARQS